MMPIDHSQGATSFPTLQLHTRPVPEQAMTDEFLTPKQRWLTAAASDFDAPVFAPDLASAHAQIGRSIREQGRGGIVSRTIDEQGKVGFLVHPAHTDVVGLGHAIDPSDTRLAVSSPNAAAIAAALGPTKPGAGAATAAYQVTDSGAARSAMSGDELLTAYDKPPRWHHQGTPIFDSEVWAVGRSSFDDVERASQLAVEAARRNELPAVVVSSKGKHTVALLNAAARDTLDGARAVRQHARFAGEKVDELRVVTPSGQWIEQHAGTITDRAIMPSARWLAVGSAAVLGVGLLLGFGLQVSNAAGSAKRQYDSGFGR